MNHERNGWQWWERHMYVYIYICVYGWGGYHMQNREATTSLVVKILKPNYAPGIRLDTAKNHRELVILLRPCTIFQPSPLHDFCWRFDPPPFFTEDSWPSSPPAKAMPSLNSHTAKPAAIHKNAFHPSAFLPKKNLRTKPLHCNAQNLARQLVLFKRKKQRIPSRELTFPTLGKEKSSSKRHFGGNMLVPWRLPFK